MKNISKDLDFFFQFFHVFRSYVLRFLPAALKAGASVHGVRRAFVMAASCAGWAESLALLYCGVDPRRCLNSCDY